MTYELSRRDFLKTTATGTLGVAAGVGTAYAEPKLRSLSEQLLDALTENPHVTYDKTRNEFFVRSRIVKQPGYKVAEVWVAHPAKMEKQTGADGKYYEKPVPDRTKPLKLMWGNIPRPAFDIYDINHDGIPDGYTHIDPKPSSDEIVPLKDRPVEEKTVFGQRFSSGIEVLIKHIEITAREYVAPSSGPR